MSARATGWMPRIVGVVLGVSIALGIVAFRGRSRESAKPAASNAESAVSRSSRPRALSEDSGAIDEIVIHYSPKTAALVEPPMRDFVSSLDRRAAITVLTARGTLDAAREYARRIDDARTDRAIQIVETDGPISPWAKDRALVLYPSGPSSSKFGLLVPPAPSNWPERENDWKTIVAIAGFASDRFYRRELPIEFDAGDFAVTGGTMIVDANLAEKNRNHGIASVSDLAPLLSTLVAERVVVLGERSGDVPRHHLSMYMTPLGDRTVLVGDPRLAQSITDSIVSLETGATLAPDRSSAVIARFDRAAAELSAAKFNVVRVPVVAYDDKTYLTYTNGIYETRGGKRTAWVPVYGRPDVDEAALATYRRLGWDVIPVRVASLIPYHGTIGCLVNVVRRGGAAQMDAATF